MEHNNAKRDLSEFETFLQRETRSTIVCACVLIEVKSFYWIVDVNLAISCG